MASHVPRQLCEGDRLHFDNRADLDPRECSSVRPGCPQKIDDYPVRVCSMRLVLGQGRSGVERCAVGPCENIWVRLKSDNLSFRPLVSPPNHSHSYIRAGVNDRWPRTMEWEVVALLLEYCLVLFCQGTSVHSSESGARRRCFHGNSVLSKPSNFLEDPAEQIYMSRNGLLWSFTSAYLVTLSVSPCPDWAQSRVATPTSASGALCHSLGSDPIASRASYVARSSVLAAGE